MTAVLAQLVSDRTCEVCGLLVHADIADNNYLEEVFVNENMRGETENVNAGSLAAISAHNAANPDGWQPELLEKGTFVMDTSQVNLFLKTQSVRHVVARSV